MESSLAYEHIALYQASDSFGARHVTHRTRNPWSSEASAPRISESASGTVCASRIAYPQRVAPQRPTRPHRRRELQLWRAGVRVVAGVDEVGRGALAGPLVVGAVVLPSDRRPDWLSQLRDSKQLSPRQREQLAPRIKSEALDWAVGWVHAAICDEIGLSAALRLANRRALDQLSLTPEVVLADGRDDLRLPIRTQMFVKGDTRIASIAAASIVAKTIRDAWMQALDHRLPGYEFARHKGYGTRRHLRALQELGVSSEHRRTFAPVTDMVQPRLQLDAAAS